MRMFSRPALAACLLIASLHAQTVPAARTETVDWQMVTRIRQEGLRNSKVMEITQQLTDRFGARLTGSPELKRANEWSRDTMTAWGLQNSRLEPFEFGRGWSAASYSVRMVEPSVAVLHAVPKAWTPATNGRVRGQLARVRIAGPADFEKYRGKLAGKIVLGGELRELKPGDKPFLARYTEKELQDLATYGIPAARGQFDRDAYMRRAELRKQINQFMVEEKVAAYIEPSPGDGTRIVVQSGGSWKPGEPIGVPTLVMLPEHYGRIARLLDANTPVQIEVEVEARFHDDDKNAYNTIAELPGTDKKNEFVVAGAHIDAWHGSTGATDNAAGVAVVMEAVRILKALGVQPRRTIRVALWGGEEQGLLGSRAHVAQNFGARLEPTDPTERAKPEFLRAETMPLHLKPEQQRVSAYFNLDNGTGRIRGIYAQENAAVVPILRAWLEPFHDLGASVVTMRNTGSTDHISFDAVGIPGFQFIQDDVEYETRTHHSTADSFERVQREDLMQASVVLASFLYHAAMRDELLPRKPEPVNVVRLPEAAAPGAAAKSTKKGR